MFKTLILINSHCIQYSLDLVTVANKLAGSHQSIIYGTGANIDNTQLTDLDFFVSLELKKSQFYDSWILTDVLEKMQQEYHFDCILILATDYGRMVAPRLAMRLNTGLTADITDIEVKNQEKLLIRPAFSGNMLASISCDTKPIMASVHPNVFTRISTNKKTELIDFPLENIRESSVKIEKKSAKKQSLDIREAEKLISLGGGFKGKLQQANYLAESIGGTIAVSKQLVDDQRATREIQVGQSGKTVSPQLYIAIGIHGAIHHIEGLKNVQHLISVNTDSQAPINSLAELVLIGDGVDFVEKLTAVLTKNKKDSRDI